MEKQFRRGIAIAFTVAALALPGGCKKDESPGAASAAADAAAGGGTAATTAGAQLSEADLQQTFGFAARTPRDIDATINLYQLGQLWQDFVSSRRVTALLANPVVQQFTNDASFQLAWTQFNTNPDAVKWRAILADALSQEFALVLGKGAAERAAALRQFSDEIRFQQMVAGFPGAGAGKTKTSADYSAAAIQALPAISANLKSVDVPPIYFSFKLASQRAALQAEIQRVEAQLPPTVDKSDVQIAGSPFRSLVFAANKMLPAEQQEQLKQALQQNTDSKTANDIFQWVMSRRLEVAYGFLDNYFILSLGANRDHLKFASSPGDSILSAPEMAPCKQFAKQPVVAISWSSPQTMAVSLQRYEILPWVERAKSRLQGTLTPADLQKLDADAQRIDAKARKFMPNDFTPAVSIAYRKDGIYSETYGGMKPVAPPPQTPLQFSGVPGNSTFLWMDQQADPAVTQAFFDWFEDVVSTAYDYAQRFALTQLPDQQKMQAGMVANIAVPKLVEFYRITREQFAKSFGPEKAFVIDLNGALPVLPQIPPPIQQSGKMPRVAYIASVQDRALLAKSWSSYFRFAQELLLLVPMGSMQFPNGVPQPTEQTLGDLKVYSYPMPMETGDLLPNVAIWKDKIFIASSSPAFAQEIGQGVDKGASDQSPATLSFRLQFGALCDFAEQWMSAAAQSPDLFFSGDTAKRDEFLKMQPDLAKLVQALRGFRGMEARVFQENGLPRSTSVMRFEDAP